MQEAGGRKQEAESVSLRSGAILRATTVVTAIVLVMKGLGFLEKLLLAYFLGTGIRVDAYLVAYGIPFSAFIVLREVVKPAFLPTYLRIRQRSEGEGRRLLAVVGTLLLVVLGLAILAGVLLADPLISVAAPGFAGEQRALAVRLTRLAVPALLLLGLSTLTTATLHAEKRFVRPALGEVAFRAGPLLLLVVLGGALGLTPAAPDSVATNVVVGMALGAILGALGKLGIEALGLGKALRKIRPALDLGWAPVRTVGRLAAPLLAALSLSLFVGPLVENAFASRVGIGGVAALAYARKIAETLTTILPYTLGLVLLPFSAEMAARQDDEGLARTLIGTARGLTLLSLPLTVGLLVLREPFVRLLLERGAFTATSTQMTAGPLLYYALALLPFSLEVIVVQFFFARQDTLTPVLADIATFALNIALIPPLASALGLGGIALAAAVAKALKVLILLVLFRRRVPAFRLASLGPFAGKMGLASLAAAGVLLALAQVEDPLLAMLGRSLPGGSTVALAAYLAIAAVLGGGAFFLVTHLLRVNELGILWSKVKKWRPDLGRGRRR
jgi:putative peptidoglycan lipid II flippase